MKRESVHLRTVAQPSLQGLAPGGIWVRICSDDEELISEYALQ
ncbi:MAG TPA: hypothetical protein VN643_03245 [Pyrinomonadaceae bacterium]|nr:hypothetical protein [Pyrinomonadaceae bacterium]